MFPLFSTIHRRWKGQVLATVAEQVAESRRTCTDICGIFARFGATKPGANQFGANQIVKMCGFKSKL